MDYRLLSFKHSPLLSICLQDIYILKTYSKGRSYTTGPNGIGLSLRLQGKSQIYYEGQWCHLPQMHIYGLIKKPQVIRNGVHFSELAIGFKPYFLQMLLKESMVHVTGGMGVDAMELFKKPALLELQERVYEAKNTFTLTTAIEKFVLGHLQPEKEDKRVMAATEMIIKNGIQKVGELAEMLNVSSTTLRNLFRDKVGLSPKEMIRVTRIRKAISHPLVKNLTSLAHSLGYFDQPHFIHDFKSCLGLSPHHYFSNEEMVFDFYNFNRWQGDSFGLIKSCDNI